MIKRKNISFLIISLVLAMITLFAFSFLPAIPTKAKTMINNSEMVLSDDEALTLSDTYYSVRFQGFNSNNSVLTPTLSEPVQVVEEENEITYICYNWSTLSHININIQRSATTDTNLRFLGVKLRLSYMQTENLTQNIQDFNGEKYLDIELYNSNGESVSFLPITYYINEMEGMEEGNQTKFGYGFGLYKFEFVYSFIDLSDSSQPNAIEKSIGSMYFAILPDDIDELSGSFGIDNEVSSSTTFLNAFTAAKSLWTRRGSDLVCLWQNLSWRARAAASPCRVNAEQEQPLQYHSPDNLTKL